MRKKFFATLGILIAAFMICGTVSAKENFSSLGKVSTQKKYTMYLGTNDKDTLRQEIPLETIREQMHEICMKHVDGYTVSVADGYWRDDKGNVAHEISLVYIFIDAPIDSIKKIMDAALIKFNQGSILLEESKGRSIFYSGSKR